METVEGMDCDMMVMKMQMTFYNNYDFKLFLDQ